MPRVGMRGQGCCLVLLEHEHQRLGQGTGVLPRRVKTQRCSQWVLLFFVVPNGGSQVGVGGK